MCGRFAQYTPKKELAKTFHVTAQLDLRDSPRYNIAPTQTITAIRSSLEDGGREFAALRWGLIPRWASDAQIGNKTFNARAETLTERPTFREPFQRRRTLIPADGFFEWAKQGGRKQPLFFYMADRWPFAFAGLWDSWRDSEGQLVESCTIITTTPNELLAQAHDRMPAILEERDYDLWLDPTITKPAHVLPLLRSYPAEQMTAHPVSLLVNNVRIDCPDCIAPQLPHS
jgi:putative SOS response-associated peptidase YedK